MIVVTAVGTFKETFRIRLCEFQLAAVTIGLGLVFWFNADLFATATGWERMSAMLEQRTWALLCLFFGGTRMVALLVNGLYYRTPHMRAIGAFFNMFLWLQMSLGLVPNAAIGAVVFPIFAICEIYNISRAIGDAALSEATYRANKPDA